MLPFNLFTPSCNASGTLTVDLVDGAAQIAVTEGFVSGTGCRLAIQADFGPTSFHVPDVGDTVTAVFAGIGNDLLVGAGDLAVDESTLQFVSNESSYVSAQLGGRVFTGLPGAIEAAFGGPFLFLPADDITISPNVSGPEAMTLGVDLVHNGLPSTYTLTTEGELFLPASAVPAAPAFSEGGRAALTAALIAVAGVFFARRKDRKTQATTMAKTTLPGHSRVLR